MKIRLRSVIVIATIVVMAVASQARGAQEGEESLGDKLKNFFVRPRPTPKPTPTQAKHRKRPTTKKKERPASTPSPSPSASPSVSPTAIPERSVAPVKASPSPRRKRSQLLEPVRPISPGPRARPRTTPSPVAEETASPAAAARPRTTPSPVAEETASPTAKATATPSGKVTPAPNATISSAEISGYENYPAEIRKIIDLALSLTTQNLGYKYGSADPANGGMDCSGFIYYVLSQSGIKDVPRDAREQYIWVRKRGNFQAVLAHRDDTFELDALKPGDLFFWTGTYGVNRDPDITHTMIYLGREKTTNQRIMVGASDGRTYKGQSRFGVSVFDFKVSRLGPKSEKQPGPAFVGYARIPGLRAE